MPWYPFNSGKNIGQRGSEGGTIIHDLEHSNGARISLEQNGDIAPFAITCGIYGWMFHTRFFGNESEAELDFVQMQRGIEKILEITLLFDNSEANSRRQEVYQAISSFVDEFP